MTHLTIHGETFRVQLDGDPSRPALLLSNSLGTDLHMWDAQLPALREHFRVIRYDSRGHGQSVTSDAPISIGDLGRDALRILDALEVERAHVVGISMGGAVAQWLMIHAPERVERAVLACTSAKFGTAEMWNQRIAAVRNGGMEGPAKATMERWFSPAFSDASADEVAAVRRMLLNTAPEGYAGCSAALRDMDLRQWLVGVDVPALIVTGAHDPVISAANTAFLRGALSDATHISLEARHIANIEAAEAFTDAVVKFLTAKRPAKRKRPVATEAKPAPRGKASARATSARRPLAKVTTRPRKAKAAAARKAAVKARKAPSPRKARPLARTASRATPAKITNKTKTAAAKKVAAKKTTVRKKATVKATPARRPTKASAVRGAVKKAVTKAKPSKTTKKKTKATTKRVPAPRRKPTKTPRRPTGRRKT